MKFCQMRIVKINWCVTMQRYSDTASSYFIGNPVTYKAEGDIKALTDAWRLQEQMKPTETMAGAFHLWACV